MSGRHVIRRGAAVVVAAATITVAPVLATASIPPHGTPAPPAAVTLNSQTKALQVAWTESTGGILVFKATATAPGKTTRFCAVTGSNTCVVGGLLNGVVYVVQVTATALHNTSAPSSPVSAMVGVPGAPLSVHTTPAVAAAFVSWSPPKASGVAQPTGYTATASPGGFSCSTAGTLLLNPARTCEIPGLRSGVAYTVTVTATNPYGTGVPSKSASVTPN